MSESRRTSRGFTLIELMVTIAIGGILIASAAPSMREFVQNNRSATQINELQAALNMGRSEAIKRSSSISICNSSNGTSCSGSWQDGWIVFHDGDADGTVDNGDEVLRVHNGLASGNTLRFTRNSLTFEGNGLLSSGANGFFIHCDSRGATKARGIIIGATGRARIFSEDDFSALVEEHDWIERFVCSTSS